MMCGICAAGIERELVEAVIEGRDDAAAFQRRHALPRGRDLARHLDRRIERLRDVDLEIGFEKDVVAPMLVHQRRARLARLAACRGRRASSSRSSVDGRRDILGLGARRRHAHGDEFADLAHLAGGEHRLLGDLEARQRRDRADRLDADEIGRGEDAVAIALRHMDAADPRMRQRTAHEGDVLQSGEANVGRRTGRGRASGDRLPCAAAARRRPAPAPAPSRKKNRARCARRRPSSIELTLSTLGRDGLRQDRRDGVVAHAGAQTERRLQQTLGDHFVVLVVAQDKAAGSAPQHRDVGIHADLERADFVGHGRASWPGSTSPSAPPARASGRAPSSSSSPAPG